MLRRCLLLVLLASLAVSAPAAWAAGVFVYISATDGNAQVWPTGVSTSGAVSMQGLNTSGYDYTYYNIDYYPGGAAGTMLNVNALFNNALTSYSTAMNDSGQFTPYIVFLGHHGWLYSAGTVSNFNVPYNGGNAFSTLSEAINSNGDIGGNYIYSTGTTAQAFVSIGGTCYPLNSVAPTYSGATIAALNTAGQAVGWEETGSGIASTDAPCGGLELHDFGREPGFADHGGPSNQRLARRRIPRRRVVAGPGDQ